MTPRTSESEKRCVCYDEPDPPVRARCRHCGRMAGPEHVCHADGCNVEVPPKMFMCKRHWFMVPKPMRDRIWATYVSGQEIRKDPTDEYMEASMQAIEAVAAKEGRR